MNNYFDDQKNEYEDESVNHPGKVKNEFSENNRSTEVETKKKSNLKTYISLMLLTSIFSSLLVGGVLYSKFSSELTKQNALIEKAGITASLSQTNTDNLNENNIINTVLGQGSPVTEIAKKVGPSIVGIRMTVGNPQSGYYDSDQILAKAEGSGVIIGQDGYIMTNYHVVQYADPKSGTGENTTLEVFLPDKRQAKATFVSGDRKSDLAVIKVDLTDLPIVEIGDSLKLEVGEQVIAIGNPLGMEFAGSVTVGVISALNREVDTENTTMNLIQTDAAINPGNSGGA